MLHKNIEYSEPLQDHRCTQRETVQVNQKDMPAAVVCSRFLRMMALEEACLV